LPHLAGAWIQLNTFLVSIFLVLLFNSFRQPAIILSSVLFGLTGVFWGFYFMDIPFSFTAAVGIVSLVGINVNDAIVMVDTMNRHRKAGLPVAEAAARGAADRLRPILSTTQRRSARQAPRPIHCGPTSDSRIRSNFRAKLAHATITVVVNATAISTTKRSTKVRSINTRFATIMNIPATFLPVSNSTNRKVCYDVYLPGFPTSFPKNRNCSDLQKRQVFFGLPPFFFRVSPSAHLRGIRLAGR